MSLDFNSIQKIYPSLVPKKAKPKKKKPSTLPVNKDTADRVKAALNVRDWITFKEVSIITGFARGTISRASKYLCGEGLAITKVDENGQARSSYLKLV